MTARRSLITAVTLLALAAGLAPSAFADPGSKTDPNCSGVRPGAVMLADDDQNLVSTWNFMLRGSDGGTYTFVEGRQLTNTGTGVSIGTSDGRHERTWARGRGPGVTDGDGMVAGHAVWFSYEGPEQQALIRLDGGQRWASGVCSIGQPTGVDAARNPQPVELSIYGQERSRPVHDYTDYLPYGRTDTDTAYKSLPVPTSDDWGAPAMTGDKQALGFLSAADGTNGRDGRHPAGGCVFRLPPLMERSGKRLNIMLSLERRPNGVAR